MLERTGGLAWGESMTVFAQVPSESDSDFPDETNDTSISFAGTAEATDLNNSAAALSAGTADLNVATNALTAIPTANAAGDCSATGLGTSWTASVDGVSGAGASLEVQADPNDSSVVNGLATGFASVGVSVSSAAGSAYATVGPFEVQSNDDGTNSSVQIQYQGVPVYVGGGTGLAVRVTFPVGVGGTVNLGAGQYGTANASNSGPTDASADCTAVAELEVEGLDPSDPYPKARAVELLWDAEEDEWIEGDVLWEDDSP
jgi:hypothetical protein